MSMNNTNEMNELYQAVILDHNKNPRNFKVLSPATRVQEGHNPVCGDHLFIYLLLDEKGETIMDLTFQGEGCAISKASASMMTAALKGKTLTQARHLFEEFHRLLTRQLDPTTQEHHLGKLQVFASIWKYPARVKCAGLCWHTLKAALEGVSTIINTEG